MKSASSALPDEPPNGVTGGLDWARDDHAVSVVDARGRELVRHSVEHSAAGLRELVEVLTRAGCGEVAIERPDGPVVETLPGAGLTVVVISPNQVKNLRGRYGSAGNKDDRFDAFVLAGTLRTDRARLRPLIPDSPQTATLRRACRARRDLVAHGSVPPTSCASTCAPCPPARSGCSPRSTARSAWRSLPAFPPRTRPTGSPPPACADGCPRSATTTPPDTAASSASCKINRRLDTGLLMRAGHVAA